MKLEIKSSELKEYVYRQLETFFPDNYQMRGNDIDSAFDMALDRLENCFKYISFPAYSNDKGQTFFSYLHADQYAQFLYFFSNSLWRISENKVICDKLISLNRALHGFYFSYKGQLPDIFFFGHPIGSVIGNADYSDYLVIFQNVTINTAGNEKGLAPKLGKGLFLGAGSKIIGDKPIGKCVSVGVDALVYNQEIADNKIVIRSADGGIEVKDRTKEKCMAQNYFRTDIQ